MRAGRRYLILVAALFALLLPADAKASGGSYTFSGGSEAARTEVRNALDASAFDWSLVPQTISIQIVDCGCAGPVRGSSSSTRRCSSRRRTAAPIPGASSSTSTPTRSGGSLWTMSSGRFSRTGWAAPTFRYERPGLSHDDHACERFASTLAWACWPVAGNPMQGEKVLWARLLAHLGPAPRADHELAFPAHLERRRARV